MRIPFRASRVVPSVLVIGLMTVSLLAQTASAPSAPAGASGSTTPQPKKIDWKKGPFTADLGGVAKINVPEGYEFADGNGARTWEENTGNPPGDTEIGILTPIGEGKDDDWYIILDFDEDGYVRDDEKGNIDADKLLETLKKQAEEENAERKRRGWIPFHVTGWQTAPFYDETTHNLTWATVGMPEGKDDEPTVNYNTRLLGRRGIVRVDLITDPQHVGATVPRFKTVMGTMAFNPGSRYADFVKGDKVAEYGLTALIAGGATAVAMKTGLFAKLLAGLAAMWKLIAVAFAALMTRIKNIFAAIKSRFSRDKGGPQGDDLSPR